MKRFKVLFYLIFILIATTQAQTFKQIGVAEGLSHRQVYDITQDAKGYIWLLTHEGVDRFNGAEYKHYNFYQNSKKLNTSIYLKSLFYTPDNNLWQVGANGQVFKYNRESDQFDLIYNYPSEQGKVTILDFGYIDEDSHIWLGNKGNIQIYNYKRKKAVAITQHPLYTSTGIAELGNNSYAIGTYQGVYFAHIKNDSLQLASPSEHNLLSKLPLHIDYLYYHKSSKKLIISTLKDGLYSYNLSTKQLDKIGAIKHTNINKIVDFTAQQVLIATSGAGVYKLNLDELSLTPYIVTNFSTTNGMNSNNITDLFIDRDGQIWMANMPIGVTVCQTKQSSYKLFQHLTNNQQSLIHNDVKFLLEDSDQDLWFATSNGVSCYQKEKNRWKNFLYTSTTNENIGNSIFVTLCEVRPGVIWAGGNNSGIYEINKLNNQVRQLGKDNEIGQTTQSDQHIKAMITDANGDVWVGGQFNLRQINYKTGNTRFYNELSLITSIAEKDQGNIWVGTAKGLFLLNKESGKSRQIQLPETTAFVNTLYQGEDGNLYIGTNEGLFIFISSKNTFKHLNKDNSGLISDNIKAIVTDERNHVVYLAYEQALAKIDLKDYTVRNWTSDQFLPIQSFSQGAAIQLKSGDLLFGSVEGALLFAQDYHIPELFNSKLILEEIEVNQRKITPLINKDILAAPLDEVLEITLPYNQNNIALKVGSINFKYPSNILYSALMKGLYNEWSPASQKNRFSYTNLSPGEYLFKIRAISKEDGSTLEERDLRITVNDPIWWDIYAKIIYIILLSIALYKGIKLSSTRLEKRIINKNKQFYYNTAHDIKVPLQLIKEPIEEIKEKENLSRQGFENIQIIIRNLNVLLAQNNNVINFEKVEHNQVKLFLSEYNLEHYIQHIVSLSSAIAEMKKVTLSFINKLDNKALNILFDKHKVDTILSNAINECIDRCESAKEIKITLSTDANKWLVEISYIGTPITKEQLSHLKKEHGIDQSLYQQSSESKKELALSLACRLIQLHKGKINTSHTDKESNLTLEFPLYSESSIVVDSHVNLTHLQRDDSHPKLASTPDQKKHKASILLIENDALLIQKIRTAMQEEYEFTLVASGKEALQKAKELRPDIIISKFNLPDMKGTEFSWRIKNDIETSHIPILLLTDNNSDKHILKGLENGADEFILKPFNLNIFKTTVAHLLASNKRLKGQYAKLEIEEPIDCLNCSTNLDWTFIASVKEKVEENMSDSSFNIDKLCTLLGMSRTSFYNKLKDLTDQSPSDFIRFIKLKHAANLLISQEHSIAEIAEMTGFNDAKYFREVFKKHFNTTPSKYAKENKL